jgi:hypothetical protein
MTLETVRFKNEGCICEWWMIADGPVGGKSIALALRARSGEPERIRTMSCAGRKVGVCGAGGWLPYGTGPA